MAAVVLPELMTRPEEVPDGAGEDERAEDQQNGLALVAGDLLAQGT